MLKFKKNQGGEIIQMLLQTEMWFATEGKYSFVIGRNESGYSASYKDREYEGKQSSHFIEGSPFKTFHQAETACRHKLKHLRRN